MLTGLISEAGGTVPYTLSISTTGPSINTFASDNPIEAADLPDHFIPLDELEGLYLGSERDDLRSLGAISARRRFTGFTCSVIRTSMQATTSQLRAEI